MFKIGEEIVLKWPERSSWPDTRSAIRDGTLTLGKKYMVIGYSKQGQFGDAEVTVLCNRQDAWTLSAACFTSAKNKQRNLPGWF